MDPPKRSEKTLEAYGRCFSVLHAEFKDTSLDFLLRHDAVIAFIESLDRSMNTKKLYYIAIVSRLKDLNSPTFSEAFKAYKAKQDAYNRKAQEVMENQEMDARERAIWIDWPDVLKLRERLAATATNLWAFQDYVILCLYTYLPPMRADYAPMVLVRDMADVPEAANALVIEPTKMTFVFQEYKTAHKYGRRDVHVPKDLEQVLRVWTDMMPTECLLSNLDGTPMDPRQLSAAVIRIFDKHTGKKTGINILRHSFISHLRRGERTFREQKKIAELMGHSVGMGVLYRRVE